MPPSTAELEILKHKGRRVLPDIRSLAAPQIDINATSASRRLKWKRRTDFFTNEGSALAKTVFDVWMCGFKALDHHRLPLYLEVVFKDTSSRAAVHELAAQYFGKLCSMDSVLQEGIDLFKSTTTRQVFIPAEIGHPDGYFFSQVSARPERQKGLVIAFLGTLNPLCCRACIRTYETTITSASGEHVLTPFHACVSIKGYRGNRCANCEYNNHICEWEYFGGYLPTSRTEGPRIHPLGGSASLDPANKPTTVSAELLNRQSAPRVSCVWSTDHSIGEGDAAAGHELSEKLSEEFHHF